MTIYTVSHLLACDSYGLRCDVTGTDGDRILDDSAHLLSRTLVSQPASVACCVLSRCPCHPLSFLPVSVIHLPVIRSLQLRHTMVTGRTCAYTHRGLTLAQAHLGYT
jgi:hypothetical protein